MKPTMLEKIYLGILAVIFALIVVHAPIIVGFGTLLPKYALVIKAWKEILMLVAVVLAVVILTRRHMWRVLMHDWLLWGVLLFAVLLFALVPLHYQGLNATVAGLAIDLRYLLFFSLVYMAVKLVPTYRGLMTKIGIAGAMVVVGFATLQLFLPANILSHIGYNKDTTIAPYLTVDKNHSFIRENSTLRGPNPLGAYAVIVLGLLTAALIRMRNRLEENKFRIITGFLAVGALVSLWVSYSRSALIAGILAIVIVVVAAAKQKIPRAVWIAACVVLLALLGGLIAERNNPFVSNVILHINPNGGSPVTSNDGHVSSLLISFHQLQHQPLGAGVGSTGSASLLGVSPEIVENQFLFVAHEAGWLGLVLFILIWGIVLSRLWNRRKDWLALGTFASGIGLVFIGLLLPVLTDDTVSIVWWGLAALVIGGSNARHKAKQKTARTV